MLSEYSFVTYNSSFSRSYIEEESWSTVKLLGALPVKFSLAESFLVLFKEPNILEHPSDGNISLGIVLYALVD